MKILARILPSAMFLAPVFALAADANISYFNNFFTQLINAVNNILIPLIFALAFLLFLWGVFVYFIFGGGDEEKREKGKMFMLYGLIGLVVMVAVWGIVNLLISILGVNAGDQVRIPQAPTR